MPLSAQTASFTGVVTALGNGFYQPEGVAVDGSGNIYVADTDNSAVKEMPSGCASSNCVTTLGGGFSYPWGVAVDGSGNIFVGDTDSSAVKEMPAGCASSSCVTSLGGGFVDPSGLAVDKYGNVYVADSENSAVKEVPPGCASYTCVTTLGGGFLDPIGVAVDGSGNVYVADTDNNAVKVMPAGCTSDTCVTTLGGGFVSPYGVAVDGSGNVYVADTYNKAVKEMPPGCASASCVTTLGGGFSYTNGVAPDGSGDVYVAEDGGVDEIMPRAAYFGDVAVASTPPSVHWTAYFTFTAGGSGITASVLTQGAAGLDFTDAGGSTCNTNGTSNVYSTGDTCTVNVTFAPKYAGTRDGAVQLLNGSGSVIATALIYGTGQGPQLVFPGNQTVQTLGGGFSFPPGVAPSGVAVDGSGNVYVAGNTTNSVTEIPPGCASSSCVTTLGGGFIDPAGVAVDGSGNLYVSDYQNNTLTEMPPGCASSSCGTILGGGFGTPNNPYGPFGVAVDGSGNVYVADTSNYAVKEVPSGCTSSACVTTLGGFFPEPAGVAVDASGNVYVADIYNSTVKEILPGCTSSNCMTTLGGGFYHPWGVALDGGGDVYVADYGNSAVKEMPPGCASSSCVTTLRLPPDVPFSGVTVDGSGNVYAVTAATSPVYELNLAAPPSLSFATTNVGSQSSDSPQAVALSNIGNAPLTFPVPGTGENPSISANFTLDSSTTCPEVTTSSSAGTLATGASCNLAVDFLPATSGSISGSAILTDNNLNASYATQSIGLSGTGATATPIDPWVQVNGGAWQKAANIAVNLGATVNLGPHPVSGGSWSWTGPNGFTSTSRVLDSVPLAAGANTYTATYTNTSGGQSTQVFTITVTTPVAPYIQVNGGAWTQESTATVNVGVAVNLGPQPVSGGSWSWAGPNGFSSTARVLYGISLSPGANTYTATYTNTAGGQSTQAFTITVDTPIVPYIQVSGGSWTQESTATVNAGTTVNLGPQPVSGGNWSWTGPNGFSSTSRVLYSIPLTAGTNTYTATYTNTIGGQSIQAFTITVNTPVTPYIQVNGGAWTQESAATVNLTDTVNLGPQPVSGGSWSWTGPNGFTSTSRVLYGIPLTGGTDTYTATYTNAAGGHSTQVFTITVSTPIDPWIQVNGGAWQEVSSVTVAPGATVNIGPHPVSGGTWSWVGPSGFTSSSRVLYAVPLPSGTNTYTATYTNASGEQTTQAFTITIN
ncbi:MAG: SBBP repeat-containing protein [Acidobacteriaceae bacterium]